MEPPPHTRGRETRAQQSEALPTTTHFHPEHAAGEPGFPPGTILIRNAVQQQEMEKHGQEMIDMFSQRSPQNKELLAGVVLRPPDVLFDQEATIDLGGVTARLLWFGGAHTKGDELTFVEPDRTLISDDVVQNKTMPNIFGDGGTPASWLAVLEKVAALNAAHVLPDHSAPGDGSLVATIEERLRGLSPAVLEPHDTARILTDRVMMPPNTPRYVGWQASGQ
jgi:glyoxylase-like metal-dependent hydrolase (beta-lactamase superfamily II)